MDAIQELLAKQAISEVIVRYARAIDRLDEAMLRSVFHADPHSTTTSTVGPLRTPPGRLRARIPVTLFDMLCRFSVAIYVLTIN